MDARVFVKITKYFKDGDTSSPSDWVSRDQPAWVSARVMEQPAASYDIDSEITLIAPLLTDEMAEDNGSDWLTAFSLIHTDDYEIVPLDEVPGEVLAEWTKYVLMRGDAN